VFRCQDSSLKPDTRHLKPDLAKRTIECRRISLGLAGKQAGM